METQKYLLYTHLQTHKLKKSSSGNYKKAYLSFFWLLGCGFGYAANIFVIGLS